MLPLRICLVGAGSVMLLKVSRGPCQWGVVCSTPTVDTRCTAQGRGGQWAEKNPRVFTFFLSCHIYEFYFTMANFWVFKSDTKHTQMNTCAEPCQGRPQSLLGCLPGIISHPWTRFQGNKPHAQNGLEEAVFRVGACCCAPTPASSQNKSSCLELDPAVAMDPEQGQHHGWLPALPMLCCPSGRDSDFGATSLSARKPNDSSGILMWCKNNKTWYP